MTDYIRSYRLVRFEFKSGLALPCKAYPPRPEHCLSFYPKDFEQVEFAGSGKKVGNLRAVLFGQQTEVSNRFVGSDFLLFQVVFKPGALFRITGVPSFEFTNCYLDAETVFSREIKNVNEKLNDCSGHEEMVAVVEAFLSNEIRKKSLSPNRIDTINTTLFTRNFLPTVDKLADEACLSTRQCERLFKERMGVSPKYFLKVLRFENTFRMKNKHPHLDWLTLALHCGYYDYQHLAKDYRDLTQKTPNDFYRMELAAPERAFGAVDTY